MSLPLAHEDTGTGPPVLILHGLFGSAMNWRRIARTIGDRHRVISVDLRNHGASPWAPTMSYAEMAGDVVALIDRLGLDAPGVVGHSMGGKVAMTLALVDPGRVGRLVVADIAPVSYGDRFSSFVDAMRSVDTVDASSREAIRQTLLRTIPDDRTVGFLMTNLVREGDRYEWRINLAALDASMDEIGAFPSTLAGRTYPGPMTLIRGARSDYVSDADQPTVERYFPHARFETVGAAGHWLHADQPDAFCARLLFALSDARDDAGAQ